MIVRFWGTRGTVPVPGPSTVRYGGNTSCVSVETDDGVLVLDAGTGFRALGDALLRDERPVFVLLTHVHSDHVHGFPYFKPLWQEGRCVRVFPHPLAERPWSPLELLDGIHFPVPAHRLPGDVRNVYEDPLDHLRSHGFTVTRLPVHHPGGAWGYRIGTGIRDFVHIPDNEIDGRLDPALIDFCRGAAVLSHDAQLVAEDLPMKKGWGHSTEEEACTLATRAGTDRLLLFHHDPWRNDEAMDAVVARARSRLDGCGTTVAAARDGDVIDLR